MVPLFDEMLPFGVPVKLNVLVPPTMTFLTITVARFVFVNVHVTVSPAAAWNDAVAVPTFPVLSESSHDTLVRSQPATAPSTGLCMPGTTLAWMVPLFDEIDPFGVPVKLKVLVPPTMTFFTMTVARFVFVNVHVTVSPAAAWNDAVAVPTFPVLSESSHDTLVRSQPATAPSWRCRSRARHPPRSSRCSTRCSRWEFL